MDASTARRVRCRLMFKGGQIHISVKRLRQSFSFQTVTMPKSSTGDIT